MNVGTALNFQVSPLGFVSIFFILFYIMDWQSNNYVYADNATLELLFKSFKKLKNGVVFQCTCRAQLSA